MQTKKKKKTLPPSRTVTHHPKTVGQSPHETKNSHEETGLKKDHEDATNSFDRGKRIEMSGKGVDQPSQGERSEGGKGGRGSDFAYAGIGEKEKVMLVKGGG